MASFRGPEPGTEGGHTPGDRIAWAAFMLARDVTTLEALTSGIAVPRNKLNPEALTSLGEPAESTAPLELTDDLALRLAVAHPEEAAAATGEDAPVFLDAYEFVKMQEEPPVPLWGTEKLTLLPQGGLVVVAGAPGAGKTTLVIDLACHLAAGLDWPPADPANERAPTPWPVARPLRVALIENEGPLVLFRDKLAEKLRVFGHDINERGGYLGIQVWRWGGFSFADSDAFSRAARELDQLQVDLVIGDPLNMLGVEGVGSPAETRDFVMRLRALGMGTTRAFMLIHHFAQRVDRREDEVARLSGSWGGHLDTLVTLAQGAKPDQVRFAYPKLRWRREEAPQPVILGKVYNMQGFEAIAEEHDAALLEPQLVDTLRNLRESGGGYKGWATANVLAERASLGRQPVRICLEQAPHLFAMRTGQEARELGAKNRTSKLYGLVEWPEASEGQQPELASEGDGNVVPLRPEPEPEGEPEPPGDDIPW